MTSSASWTGLASPDRSLVRLTPPLFDLLVALLDSDVLEPELGGRIPILLQDALYEDYEEGKQSREIPSVLVRVFGMWCTSDGRQRLVDAGLDPADYHPHNLAALTTYSLPPRTRAPAPSSNPDTATLSPYLPASIQRKAELGIGKELSGVGRELTAVANVLFSAGGVGGGVWYLGRRTMSWRAETNTLVSLAVFLAMVAIEATLYIIYFNKAREARAWEARSKERWNKAGLTPVPVEEESKERGSATLLEAQEDKDGSESTPRVVEIGEAGVDEAESGGLRQRRQLAQAGSGEEER